ncbi:restriction endonuclease subunit S [Streptomyces abyssomicinicus]|uniref:restriction endonuclease subunit S n=1 Tax=Streptomyces abyssomicinicus TaxID=574929 RepID=UPI00124FA29D|nr:restriction endonuclease subunit S [Streptomyces abyssomicinicus]
MSHLLLEDLCELIVDCKNRTPPEAQPGASVAGFAIGTPNIIDGRIRISEAKPVDQETFDTWTSRAIPREGDIVLTREAPVGRVGRVEAGMDICLGQRTMLLRPSTVRSDSRFLHYLLLSPVVQDLLHGHASGSTVAHLRVAQVRELKLPEVPDVFTQRQIGAVLGALDDKIAVNQRIASTADQLADAVFDRTVRSVGSRPMVEIVEPVLGGTPDRKVEEFWGGDLPWASVKDVANSVAGALVVTEECITTLGEQSSRAKRMPAGAVILTARGTIGLVARLTISAAFNQSCYAFVPGEIPPAVLFHLIRLASTRMMGLAHGTVFSTVNMKTFQHVAVPDIPRELLHSLEVELSPLHGLIEANLKESLTLSTLRDTLLPQLMSGRLRVKDAEKIVEDHV